MLAIVQTSAAASVVLEQVVAICVAARTELVLFCLAFVLQQLVFGHRFPRPAGKRIPKCVPEDQVGGARRPQGRFGASPDEDELYSGPEQQAYFQCRSAYERGDHRGVLRIWSASLRRSQDVPARLLGQVVESMQRSKSDGAATLSEVQGYLRRNKASCDIGYINTLLEPLAKSLDTALVNGLLELLPALDLQADSRTYEMLIQMHFATRSLGEVSRLADEITASGLLPTPRTSLMLLKTAVQAGRLDEAMQHYKAISGTTKVPSVSLAPQHIAAQLVDLACREQRLDIVLQEIVAERMPLTTEMLNTMLAECDRVKDAALQERLEKLAKSRQVELNGRTFQILTRGAASNPRRLSSLLQQMAESRVECPQEVVTRVLAAGDEALVEQLYEQVCKQPMGQAPALVAFVRHYAEAGKPERACDIFAQHLKPKCSGDERVRRSLLDAKTERCLVSAAASCGRQEVVASLVAPAPADTARHIAMIRSCALKGNLQEALRVFEALEAAGADLTASLHNALLDACVECKDLDRAERFMQRMVREGKADAVSYNTLIKAHLRYDNYKKVRELMATMRQAGCMPNPVTYNELINALVRSDRESQRAQVWEVVEEMKQNGVTPNRVTCSILFRSLKAKSQPADFLRIMELAENLEEPMDEVLLSSVVEACVRIGKPSLLTEKLGQLQGKGAIPITGAHTFGSLIKAYGHAHDIAGAWRCWKTMRSQRITPTSITIGCMVEAVVANGDVDGGYELISQLLEDDQCKDQVNAVVFGSVLKGFGRARRIERVMAAFEEMRSKGIEPSVATFNTVIDACVRNNQMERLPSLVADMKERGLTPNLITQSTIIKGACQRGDMAAAFTALKELRRTPGVKPDEIVYNTLLEGCANAGLASEGEQLLEEMKRDGVAPGSYTLMVAVKLLSQAGRVARALDLLDSSWQKHHIKANANVFGSLLQACISSRDWPRAEGLLDKASQVRVYPDLRLCHQAIDGAISGGALERASAMIRLVHMGMPERQGATQSADALLNDSLKRLEQAGCARGARLAQALQAELRTTRPRGAPAPERKVTSNTFGGNGRRSPPIGAPSRMR